MKKLTNELKESTDASSKILILTDRWLKHDSDYITSFSEGVYGNSDAKTHGSVYKAIGFINDKLRNIYPCSKGDIKYHDTKYSGNIDITIKDDKGKDHYSQLYWEEGIYADFISISVDNPITEVKIPFKETEHKRGSGKREFMKLAEKFLKSAVGVK